MSKTDRVRRLFKPSTRTPAEEAAVVGSVSTALSAATAGIASRSQQRLAYGIRWLKALQDVAMYAEQAFGQVTEEAVLDTVDTEGTAVDFPCPRSQADFTTSGTGETEKIAETNPLPPMNRAQRRAAMAEGKPIGPPAGPRTHPRKDAGFKGGKRNGTHSNGER